jgi:hypothetical protein
MSRQNGSNTGAIRTSTLTLFLGFAVAGCSDQGESKPSPAPGSVGGTSTAGSPDSGETKTSPATAKNTAKVRPGTQNPGEANYGDKPGGRGQGR